MDLLRRAVLCVFADVQDRDVEISIAVVDDATIHLLNRQHLGHDYPTDVLSFPLEDSPDRLQGEIVVSADTAQQNAPDFGWSFTEELCLYVVHGALHLVGFRDKTTTEADLMRQAEREMLAQLGVRVP
jgi:probable rRNA maturation factor